MTHLLRSGALVALDWELPQQGFAREVHLHLLEGHTGQGSHFETPPDPALSTSPPCTVTRAGDLDKDGLISYDEFVMLFRHANPDTTVSRMVGHFEFRAYDSATSGARESLTLVVLVFVTLPSPRLIAS